jgi:hypothetical protein
MVEREMQELLWRYPERFLHEPMKQIAWEASSDVGRADLVFEDRHGRLLIIEVKHGKMPRGAIDQLPDYFGMIKQRQLTHFGIATYAPFSCATTRPVMQTISREAKSTEVHFGESHTPVG